MRLTRYLGLVWAKRCLAVLCLALALQGAAQSNAAHARAERFLQGRSRAASHSMAMAMMTARRQHAALVTAQAASGSVSLNASWEPVGPSQIVSALYGKVTGRVTAIALDPDDTSGNTVYLGTTGGGVWRSTNAAGAAGAVSFVPLTDTITAAVLNAGASAIPSLSVGAMSVRNHVVLAGTGDPNDATDSYYGSGVLRSADDGSTWALIEGSQDGIAGNHSFVGLGIAGFAWSSDTTVVMAVSDAAEGDRTQAVDAVNSVRGLYYSNDAGATWQMATVMDGSQTVQTPLPTGGNLGGNAATSVVWNPVRQRFYAAVRYHGYYESADGATWTRLAQQPGAALTLAACPTNPGTTGNPACPMARGVLGVQAQSGDLFALTVDGSNQDQGLWQDVCASSGSECSGAVSFGKQLAATPLEQGGGSTVIPQADYNLALSAVAAGTDTLLFVGTADLYRCSLSAGCTLRNTTNATNGCNAPAGVAGAQHAIATLATGAQPLVYLGNDGGLWRSTDGVNEQSTPCSADDATHFANLNGGLGSLAEIMSFAEDPTDANTLLAGFGANGSAGTAAAATETAWPQLAAGEGGTVAIDPANPQNWYLSTAAGVSIGRCTNGGSCATEDFAGAPAIGLPQVANDASLIDPPWLLDPALPASVLIGTCRVWRGAADGSAWSTANVLSPNLVGASGSACTGSNGMVRSLAAGGPALSEGSTVLYAGMAGGTSSGHLFATTMAETADSTTAWTDLATSPVTNGSQGFNPDGFDLSSVVVDAHDATGKTLYVTVMGFGIAHVYRSIDAGAHWTNISSNLPNAPANSVAVDPNDADTVYVALDTGVYVSSSVPDCVTANCWSVLGVGLPGAPVVQLAAAATMPTTDGRYGVLRAATYGRGIWQMPLLTATSALEPVMSLSPAGLSFGPQVTGTLSSAQTVTVTNIGSAPLTVSEVTISGGLGTATNPLAQDFTETDTCTAAAVPVHGSCTVEVSFLPLAANTRPGVLTIFANVAGGQATVTLTGDGLPSAAVVLTPSMLSFPATLVGAVSTPQNVTVANTGSTAATLGTPSVTGDFRITTTTCGASLGAGLSCTLAVAFAPSTTQASNGVLTLTDSAGTQTVSLSGTGAAPATDALSPPSLSFAAQTLNTVSAPQQVVLTNSGDVALTLISAQVTGGDFTAANACGSSLNAHARCAISVSYVPKNVGPETGMLTVSDQFRSQTVALAGTGIAPAGVSLAPFLTVSFPPLGVGLASAAQTVTLTNNGGLALHLSGVTASGDFLIVPGSDTCGSVVAVGAVCTMQMVFTPTASGVRTGVLTVSDDASGSPQTLTLTGTGVDFSLAAESSSQTVTSGQSASYALLLSSNSGVPGAVNFTCSGAPAHATCNVTPASVALGGGQVLVTVTVATGVASASLATGPQVLWAALLLPMVILLPRRGRRWLAMMALVGLVGCGSSRLIPGNSAGAGNSGTPTPGGTSTVVVTAASAGLVRSVNLTLVVQ